ncbi:MAG: chemotaxis protein CheB [Selenomonadaceae bacterium]|nr:chemotaxis protein CheB [Selenomonadaceae bacterium]
MALPTESNRKNTTNDRVSKLLSIAGEAAAMIAANKAAITKKKIEIIAIGSSTGGTEALSQVLPKLRPPLPPVVVVQHIPEGFSKLFADRMNSECVLNVKEAVNGDIVKPNSVYIAPGGQHMAVHKVGDITKICCHMGPKLHGCRPAVDVLFHSISHYFTGGSSMAVILTGIGHDGARGMLDMKQQGSPTIGQDEATSVVYGMPKAAFELGAVDKQFPLNMIAAAIMNRVKSNESF